MQMVAPEEAANVAQHHHSVADTGGGTGTFGKLKQTLSSSLLTAQDKGMPYILLYSTYIYSYIHVSIPQYSVSYSSCCATTL